ncbi:tyrosinase family protein [Vibrio variabilis]|uniref:tyrosinase family protein n=1 Tax=Vibrio variabilis TaxID=990271 RepID=UPI001EFA17CC|nr:tyrosinase family protein [Vibrio variabilis]
MINLTRTNILGQSGENPNDALHWYAKAIDHMRGLDVRDPRSWGWWAACHQYEFNDPDLRAFWEATYTNAAGKQQHWVTGVKEQHDTFTDSELPYLAKCPHGSVMFLAWHRQYLLSFENMLRSIITQLGGPADWALPYWDYTTSGEANMVIPEPFLNEDSPLFYPGRVGGNYNFYKQSVESVGQVEFEEFSTKEFWSPNSVESWPHDHIHDQVGGAMGSLPTAGLDPLFYCHHANIDRLWTFWTGLGGIVEIDDLPHIRINNLSSNGQTDKMWLMSA